MYSLNVLGRGGQNRKVVAAAATPVTLVAASTPCAEVTITPLPANTGQIAWGWSNTVRATAGGEIGALVGDGVTIAVRDLLLIFIDASVNGEGVSFTYSAVKATGAAPDNI